jgi:hypothetical protein
VLQMTPQHDNWRWFILYLLYVYTVSFEEC